MMRQIQKIEPPQSLIDNADVWLRATKRDLALGKTHTDAIASRYNKKDIKEQLLRETKDKCAYCEQFVKATEYGDIEHIIPKSKNVDLAFSWENLTIACRLCNGSKSDFWSGISGSNIVDPYNENPKDFLWFLGERVFARVGNEKGEITVHKLDLDREKLVERRRTAIEGLHAMVARFLEAKNPEHQEAIRAQIRKRWLSEDCEFTEIMNVHLSRMSADNPLIQI